jgi:preprotein translocase subunit SecF
MLRILQNTHIDFIKARRVATLTVLAFILPALVWIAVSNFRYSVEFTGGTLVHVRFAQAPNMGTVRSALSGSSLRDVEIQTFGTPNEIVVRAQDPEHVAQQAEGAEVVASTIRQSLTERFGANAFKIERTEAIGARVGRELRTNALVAMLISFAATLLYLAWRFEWRLAVAAVLANVHDIIATFAFIKYAQIEISLFVIGGILTVIGYSLNDKVVVFDRVRELLRTKVKTPLYDTLNRAVNETLPRTVMTGTTVIACLLSLIFLGGDVLRPFALVLLFGIIIGTFSSIYVAAPVLLWIHRKWPPKNEAAPTSGSSTGRRPAREPGAEVRAAHDAHPAPSR